MDVAFFAGLFVALRLLTRHTLAAVVAGAAAVSFMAFSNGFLDFSELPAWMTAVYAICGGGAIALLYTRVGILSGIVALFVLVPNRASQIGKVRLKFRVCISPRS